MAFCILVRHYDPNSFPTWQRWRIFFSERTCNQVISDDLTLSTLLCPIATFLRIHFKWLSLSPVFCLHPTPASKRRCFLSVLEATVTLGAFPKHIYCINLKTIHAHSIRVYACGLAILVARITKSNTNSGGFQKHEGLISGSIQILSQTLGVSAPPLSHTNSSFPQTDLFVFHLMKMSLLGGLRGTR